MKELFNLKNRIAVVTGGSRGIGKSIALGLSEAGAKVVVTARNVNLLKKVVKEICERGCDGFAIECDLNKYKDMSNLIKGVIDRYGKIDILVNNAGISPFVKKSEYVKREEWEKVIRINLTAPFVLCQEAGKCMLENRWGRIINVTSIGGLVGLPGQIAYCVTKGGLIQMTKALAVEWSQSNITVNTIAPGYTITDLTEGMRASKIISENLLNRTPIRRFGEADEIVGAALYLASESASYTTGSVIVVDGGWMAS